MMIDFPFDKRQPVKAVAWHSTSSDEAMRIPGTSDAGLRSLPAVEGLGACTLIASDKTGTLTQNRLSVERILLADGTSLDRDAWSDHATALEVIAHAGAICNEASLDAGGHPVGDTVDIALLNFAAERGADIAKLAALTRSALLPYEPATKYATATVAEPAGEKMFVKGAPEVVRAMCGAVSIDVIAAANAMASDGFRIIAVASGAPSGTGIPTGLELIGWVGLIDPVRPRGSSRDRPLRCRNRHPDGHRRSSGDRADDRAPARPQRRGR